MPPKVALSPLQDRLMWLLEEAGEETVTSVRATVDANENELARAIEELERLGYLERATQFGTPSLVLTVRGRDALTR